jgi:hypothetical protein
VREKKTIKKLETKSTKDKREPRKWSNKIEEKENFKK